MARHVILIGLPGAGKTTVGALAAVRLETWFLDLDQAIEQQEGTSITEIFARRGEGAFRVLERRAMEAALTRDPGVIAAGGGWAAHPGNLSTVGDRALVLYLYTGPEQAAARTVGTVHRPLLTGDRRTELEDLLERRRDFYEQAHAAIETDERTAAEVAGEAVALAHGVGGW